MLIDTHCHLTSERLADDAAGAVARARAAGVRAMVTIGTDPADWAAAAAVADAHDDVWFAAGLHPHDASRWDASTRDALLAALDHPRCVALGEIGLDYHYDFAPKEVQRRALVEQLSVAAERGLPVVIHCREAYDDLLALLDEATTRPFAGLMHCFTEGRETADRVLERGLMLGLGGAVTFRNAIPLQQAAAALPAGSFVLETDAPFMAPVPYRGKRNEPAYTAHTAVRLAELRGTTPAAIAAETSEAACRFFRRDLLAAAASADAHA
jgi:TatD DNase family protein